MNEKALKTLEYTKIIDQLTEYASTEMGKQMCRELQPSCDLGTIRQSQTETTDALTRVRMKGSLSFGGVKDVRGSMKRSGNRKFPGDPGASRCQLPADSRCPRAELRTP